MQICADIEFPEVNRHLALRGVELVLCPSLTWNRRGAERVRYGAHARAMENQLYVVTAPLVGSSRRAHRRAIHGTGHALVAGPIDRTFGLDDGVVVDHADTRTEGMVVADLDLDLIAASRADPNRPGCPTSGRTSTRASPPPWSIGCREDGAHRAFGIEHPIVSAGMARVAQAPLVAAVSEAGGMGCLGGVSYLADALRDEIQAIRRATSRPFAVNLLVPPSLVHDDRRVVGAGASDRWDALSAAERERCAASSRCSPPGRCSDQVEVVLDERPAAVVLTFDVPDWFVDGLPRA